MEAHVIFNKHTARNIPVTAVLIDRTTRWGNKYRIGMLYKGKRLNRTDVLKLFREYLDEHPELVAQAKIYLKGHDLICWCKPEACHGDIWLEYIYKD